MIALIDVSWPFPTLQNISVTLNGTQMSPAVNERIHAIQDRLNRMCVNSQNRAFERKIEETIQKFVKSDKFITSPKFLKLAAVKLFSYVPISSLSV